jgi:hypothetical protein
VARQAGAGGVRAGAAGQVLCEWMELGGRRAGARAQALSEQEQGSGLVQAAGAEQSGRAASCAWEQAAEVERCELAVELTRGWAGFSRFALFRVQKF